MVETPSDRRLGCASWLLLLRLLLPRLLLLRLLLLRLLLLRLLLCELLLRGLLYHRLGSCLRVEPARRGSGLHCLGCSGGRVRTCSRRASRLLPGLAGQSGGESFNSRLEMVNGRSVRHQGELVCQPGNAGSDLAGIL